MSERVVEARIREAIIDLPTLRFYAQLCLDVICSCRQCQTEATSLTQQAGLEKPPSPIEAQIAQTYIREKDTEGLRELYDRSRSLTRVS